MNKPKKVAKIKTAADMREGKAAGTAFETSMRQILNPLPQKKKRA